MKGKLVAETAQAKFNEEMNKLLIEGYLPYGNLTIGTNGSCVLFSQIFIKDNRFKSTY